MRPVAHSSLRAPSRRVLHRIPGSYRPARAAQDCRRPLSKGMLYAPGRTRQTAPGRRATCQSDQLPPPAPRRMRSCRQGARLSRCGQLGTDPRIESAGGFARSSADRWLRPGPESIPRARRVRGSRPRRPSRCAPRHPTKAAAPGRCGAPPAAIARGPPARVPPRSRLRSAFLRQHAIDRAAHELTPLAGRCAEARAHAQAGRSNARPGSRAGQGTRSARSTRAPGA
jgi:hypothetical protein